MVTVTQDGPLPGVIRMTAQYNRLYEEPAYGLPEAAVYIKVPYTTLRY